MSTRSDMYSLDQNLTPYAGKHSHLRWPPCKICNMDWPCLHIILLVYAHLKLFMSINHYYYQTWVLWKYFGAASLQMGPGDHSELSDFQNKQFSSRGRNSCFGGGLYGTVVYQDPSPKPQLPQASPPRFNEFSSSGLASLIYLFTGWKTALEKTC